MRKDHPLRPIRTMVEEILKELSPQHVRESGSTVDSAQTALASAGVADVVFGPDNYATHKPKEIRAWFLRRPRHHLHFTSTHSSWLNQVEAGSPYCHNARRLNLEHTRRIYQDVADKAGKKDWSYRDFLLFCWPKKWPIARQTRLQRFTRKAHFPFFKTIDEFDFSLQATLRQSLLGSTWGRIL